MKILWLCNIMLPKVAPALNLPFSPAGGWLTGLSNDLLVQDNLELVVCFPYKESLIGNVENLKYYGFCGKEQAEQFSRILTQEQPDLVHIFGTEFSHTLSMVNCCEKLNLLDRVVINIQGLVSVIADHYSANLPHKIVYQKTLRDYLGKPSSIIHGKQTFIARGKEEVAALQKVKHVIGRTDWDRACALQYNPEVNYHFCNETLRDSFYSSQKWSIDDCQKHSIFLSQCSYPIKGFHFMLEAMPEVIKHFPNAHIYTTGRNPLAPKNIIDYLKITSYQKYLGELIKKYKLEKHVTFLGSLDETAMRERFLQSHVFVSASTIENSPNSVGEAMILGVPSISSDVGGVKNMMTHNTDDIIYQADATYMLAYYIKEMFYNTEQAKIFSINAQQHANATHNRQNNLETML
ncbi:MAG: glycosyltransferase family 4 protein, partial [Lentisphaeria bacterium]